jgi:hypothetical protein
MPAVFLAADAYLPEIRGWRHVAGPRQRYDMISSITASARQRAAVS